MLRKGSNSTLLMKALSIREHFILSVFLVVIYSCDGDDVPIDCMSGTLTASVSNVINASCGLDNASFELSVSGGSGPYEFSLTGVDFQNVSSGSNRIETVPPGNYNLRVRDTNDCVTNVLVTISNQNTLSASTAITTSGCETADGIITVNASGGQEPYTFSLDGETTQAENTFSGIMRGDYTAFVTDNNGCQTTVSISVLSGASYKNDIIPIIELHCAISNCHDGSNTALPDWTNYTTVQSLAETIKTRTSNETMPPPERQGLKPSEIQSISCWVDDGALNN